MHRNIMFRKLSTLFVVGGLAMGVAACEDDPTDVDHDHIEPASVRLVLNGAEIAHASGAGTGGTATGHVHAHVGEETAHIHVEFLDEDGDVIEFDEDHYLGVEVADESVAEFEQDTPGEFGGHVHGHAEGETTLVLMLMHGAVGSGHSDFDSAPIEIEVADHDDEG